MIRFPIFLSDNRFLENYILVTFLLIVVTFCIGSLDCFCKTAFLRNSSKIGSKYWVINVRSLINYFENAYSLTYTTIWTRKLLCFC